MSKKRLSDGGFSDKQAIRKRMPKNRDHEFANEPLSMNEKMNNKKTKKRQ